MKKKWILNWVILVILAIPALASFAAEAEGEKLIDLLVQKGVITIDEAAGLRADLAIKQQEEKAQQKEFTISTGRLLKVSGYTQPRYAQDNASNTFSTKRTRLDIKGDITERFDYRFQSEFVGTAAKLLDISVGFKINPNLKATVGQFKIPFSQENLLSSPKLETVERSQVVEGLVARGRDVIGNQNGRDIGVQVGGSSVSMKDFYLVDYAVGVFNGSGINASDMNKQKDIVGRLVIHPAKDWSLGGAYYRGTYTPVSSPALKGDRDRVGAEFAYVHESASLKGEYIKGKDGLIHKDGWYIQGGYFLIPRVIQSVIKYDTYDPNRKIIKNETNISTIGINWYFSKWVVFQIDYLIKDEQGKEINNNSLIGQLTLQF